MTTGGTNQAAIVCQLQALVDVRALFLSMCLVPSINKGWLQWLLA